MIQNIMSMDPTISHTPVHCCCTMQWSRNDIHIGSAKRGVVDCFYDFGVKVITSKCRVRVMLYLHLLSR